MPSDFRKDPNEVLDYQIDWDGDNYLGSDTISTSEWLVPSGITKDSDTTTTTTTTIWLSGGTLGRTYRLTNRIVTAGGRTADRTITITMVNK